MDIVEEATKQLARHEKRERFGIVHKITPVIIMHSWLVVYVIRTSDFVFDITGIVIFNIGLLGAVLSCHWFIWEVLAYTRTYCRTLTTRLQEVLHHSTIHASKKKQSSKPPTWFLLGPIHKQYLTPTPLQRSDSSASEDDVTSSSCSGSLMSSTCSLTSTSSSSSSSSSSFCNISDVEAPASQLTTSSLSCFVVDLPANGDVTQERLVTSSKDKGEGYSDVVLQKSCEQDKNTLKTTDSVGSSKREESMGVDILPSVHVPAQSSPLEIDTRPTEKGDIAANDIESRVNDTVGKCEHVVMVTGRLSLLQDVYTVMDIFKCLLCLDSLRHLLFYYSIYYWKLSYFQMMHATILPSLVIVVEVSLSISGLLQS